MYIWLACSTWTCSSWKLWDLLREGGDGELPISFVVQLLNNLAQTRFFPTATLKNNFKNIQRNFIILAIYNNNYYYFSII